MTYRIDKTAVVPVQHPAYVTLYLSFTEETNTISSHFETKELCYCFSLKCQKHGARTHTRTHTRTHARTHARTHTSSLRSSLRAPGTENQTALTLDWFATVIRRNPLLTPVWNQTSLADREWLWWAPAHGTVNGRLQQRWPWQTVVDGE